MRIEKFESWRESIPLVRPYTIATRSIDAVDLLFVRLTGEGGHRGLGCASPVEKVTGESLADCQAALEADGLRDLVGEDVARLGHLCRRLERLIPGAPAARAAVDMALWDLFARGLGVPVVDLLGRCHEALPTSITIGIKGREETLEEADEYLSRGFRHLKVKVGLDFAEDVERLTHLRRHVGREVAIRVDANQGYDAAQTLALADAVRDLQLELVEQPMPAGQTADMLALPATLRASLAADESLMDASDAASMLASPPGIFNIKLMKCGGITPARDIATVAGAAGIGLMWGCMDESVVSIAAALHLAYACPATRYLDLDGSLDLARDPGAGGFEVVDGRLVLAGGPGLGVRIEDD